MASPMVVDVDLALDGLKQLKSTFPPDLHPYLIKFNDSYESSLWHQLTNSLLDFIRQPNAAQFLIPLYTSFIAHFWKKLNRLSFSYVALAVAEKYPSPEVVIDFLKGLLGEMKSTRTVLLQSQEDAESQILLQSAIASSNLLLDRFEEVEGILKTCEKSLDDLTGANVKVSAAYYRVAAEYHKKKADYGEYYKTALLFLGCIKDLEGELGRAECQARAYSLALATLMRESMTNFGELLMHPILDFLTGTPQAWIRSLLFAFNKGSFSEFEAQMPALQQEPLLVNNMVFLRQKLCLMTLAEMVFSRKADERSLTFGEIAQHIRIPAEEVEALVMKALALHLIEGSIDEVDKMVHVTWVQPRVLAREEVGAFGERLQAWTQRVRDMQFQLLKSGGELITKMESH